MNDGPRCKIDVVVDRRGLDGTETRYSSIDERLLTRWTGADGQEADGYRSLAEWFNKRLLKHVYDEHGRDTTGQRLENDHEALTGADDIVRDEVMDSLRGDGIEAKSLVADMISWSTMRDHLKSCLDGEKTTADAATDWERNSVEVAKHVTAGKVEDALTSLDRKGRLPGGVEAEVELQVLLSCPECPTRIPFLDALERGFVCSDHLGISEVTR